jgi:hypothetical protein
MKEAFVQKLETQLKDWEGKLSAIKDGGLGEWREKRDFAVGKLDELRTSGTERFDVLRMGVESAWAELRTAFETATSAKPNETHAEEDDGKDRRVA